MGHSPMAEKNSDVRLDLGGAILARGDLPEADLHGANLAHADARGEPEQGQLV
jgi:uncharacterized protein YjbI with pentapeptide repeats